jgi:hypothetical protein
MEQDRYFNQYDAAALSRFIVVFEGPDLIAGLLRFVMNAQ